MDISKLIKKVNKADKKSVIAVGIGAGAAALACVGAVAAHKLLKKRKKEDKILELPYEDMESVQEIKFSYTENTRLSFDEAYKIALEAAKKQFGENAIIVPASEKKALNITIDGAKRACYMFGADRDNFSGGAMEGMYHVDGNTGEVFDNGKGKMTKIM